MVMKVTLRRIGVVLAAVVLVAGCSSGGTSSAGASQAAATKVTLQLQWFPQAQFAGYYAGLEKGFYAKEGIDLTIKPGAVEIVPATVVASGQAQFGISWVPRMLAPREAGADVVLIGQIFQRSPTLQVSFKTANITSPEQFKGKRIGSWGFGNESELYAGMRKAGINPDDSSDVTIVPQQFDMNAFLKGEIDAAQAMVYNEYAQVLETKNPATGQLYKPDDFNVVSWEQYGTAMLQDAIFTDESWLAEPGHEDHLGQVPQGVVRGLGLLSRPCRRMRPDRPQVRCQAAQGSSDLAAQRDQQHHLARTERDRDHRPGGVPADRRHRGRGQDPQGPADRQAVSQRSGPESP